MTEPIEVEVAKRKVLAKEPSAYEANGIWGRRGYGDFSSSIWLGANWFDAASCLPARVEAEKPEEQREWCAVCEAYLPIEMREDRKYCSVCDTFLTRMVAPIPSATEPTFEEWWNAYLDTPEFIRISHADHCKAAWDAAKGVKG